MGSILENTMVSSPKVNLCDPTIIREVVSCEDNLFVGYFPWSLNHGKRVEQLARALRGARLAVSVPTFSRDKYDPSERRASPARRSFPSSANLRTQSSKMILSSGYARSTARRPEATSKATIPKLKTSDLAVATYRFRKLSGGKYPMVPPILVVSASLNSS
ncbi:hypothetical protein Cgig2_001827 [Carnegiea gigantea]|uniref:Uncharacterized protein n=1 Tax=Carnegiea gigantea TaxID=171969 RepID=A0A9Q1GP69_9CARY|nr:hypothetical protein Cgig2_001827 [Carnegiea gigantea]